MTTWEAGAGKPHCCLTLDKVHGRAQVGHMTKVQSADVSAPKQVKSTGMWGVMDDVREFVRLTNLQGGLLPQSAVATVLGVTRRT